MTICYSPWSMLTEGKGALPAILFLLLKMRPGFKHSVCLLIGRKDQVFGIFPESLSSSGSMLSAPRQIGHQSACYKNSNLSALVFPIWYG